MKKTRAVSTLSYLALLALLSGCGGALTAGPDAGSGQDAGFPPVESDAGTPDAGTSEDPGPPCEGAAAPCAIHWTESAAFPTAVDHHTAFAYTSAAGSYVYVVGGVTSENESVTDIYDTVRRAKVNDDGSLGAWEPLANLPRPMAFHGMALTGDRVYLVAGLSRTSAGPIMNRTTLIGDLDHETGILTWRVGTSLPESFLHPSAQVLGNRLYSLGGSGNMMDPRDKVYVSVLDETGMTGPWNAAPSFPVPRSHHVTVVRDGHVYAIGGVTTGQLLLQEVLRSTNDATGAITGWELAGELADPPATAAGFIRGDWVYVLGGMEGDPGYEHYTGRVRRARFDADGYFTDGFEEVRSPLPIARAHVHHVPVVNGRIYSIGGRIFEGFNSIDRVFIGQMGAE